MEHVKGKRKTGIMLFALRARQEPPEICPICKVTEDRFERFSFISPAKT